MISKISRHRRRSSLSRRRSSKRGRGLSNLNINWRPIILIGGGVLGVAALVLVVIFVIVPLFGGGPDPTATATNSATATPIPTPMAREDMSDGATELTIEEYKNINDPYVFGNEVIFSTGAKYEDAPEIDRLAIYNLTDGSVTEVSGIEKKYNSLFEPKMNDKYIVYLDCKSESGGAIVGVDRTTGETFTIREYLYGKPYVSLSGNYVCWMQQTGRGVDSSGNATYGTDRLYVYDMTTQEAAEIETFANTYFSYSWAYIGDDGIVYVQPDGEERVISQDHSSSSTDAVITVIPLTEGGDQQAIRFKPGTFVYNPLIEGDYIVYLDGTGGPGTNLMMCKKTGNTYSAPVVIATDVLNYDVGDGYLVYTLDQQAVYIYYFGDESTGRLSSTTSRSILASANGKDVVWYDVTDGLDSPTNVIMHIVVP